MHDRQDMILIILRLAILYILFKGVQKRGDIVKVAYMRILLFLALLPALVAAGIEKIPQYDELPAGYNNCKMETNGELFVISLIEEGDTVFDVGANKGDWSLHALAQGGSINLYSFEPLPTLFPNLCETLGDRAECVNQALSDAPGIFVFYYYPKHPALSSFHRRSPEVERQIACKPRKMNVSATTLDLFCSEREISFINLLKIDTEGHELSVLRGARGMLESGAIRYIQFEYGGCYSDAGTHLKDVYTLLTSCGYEIYRIFEGGLIRVPKWHPSLENYQYSNYLAVSKR